MAAFSAGVLLGACSLARDLQQQKEAFMESLRELRSQSIILDQADAIAHRYITISNFSAGTGNAALILEDTPVQNEEFNLIAHHWAQDCERHSGLQAFAMAPSERYSAFHSAHQSIQQTIPTEEQSFLEYGCNCCNNRRRADVFDRHENHQHITTGEAAVFYEELPEQPDPARWSRLPCCPSTSPESSSGGTASTFDDQDLVEAPY